MFKFYGLLFLLLLSGLASAQASWQSVPIGTNGTPRGYWEFLPSDYAINAQQDFPIVIFFHGLGQGGNGDTQLNNLLNNGPAEMVEANPQSNVFGDNQVIMLAPQLTLNTWWNEHHMRPFLNYVLSQYRIDERRIYFTGISAGAGGLHQFMNDDPNASQVTAYLPVAVRGKVDRDKGAYLAALTPYWGLTARGDAANTLTDSVDRMAGFLAGIPNTNVMATYPGDAQTRTGYYHPDLGWTWVNDVDLVTSVNPKLSLYPGSSHNSWEATYNNNGVWAWLFSQIKPELNILQPTNGALYNDGQITFMATAVDSNSVSINNISWSSDIDGFLGTGEQLPVLLSNGHHSIEATAIDTHFRGVIKSINIQVDTNGVDLIFSEGFEAL